MKYICFVCLLCGIQVGKYLLFQGNNCVRFLILLWENCKLLAFLYYDTAKCIFLTLDSVMAVFNKKISKCFLVSSNSPFLPNGKLFSDTGLGQVWLSAGWQHTALWYTYWYKWLYIGHIKGLGFNEQGLSPKRCYAISLDRRKKSTIKIPVEEHFNLAWIKRSHATLI